MQGYLSRLTALQQALDRETRIAGGAFAAIREDDSLSAAARRLAERRVITA
ncbi:hypothetical protein HS125_15895 [bacterium]|nr:hypothetical protein [bacterium]